MSDNDEPWFFRDSAGIYVIARDRARKHTLLGGLGAMGVGQMWFPDEPDAATRWKNWETAPEQKDETELHRGIDYHKHSLYQIAEKIAEADQYDTIGAVFQDAEFDGEKGLLALDALMNRIKAGKP